jgi:hypothetical protein
MARFASLLAAALGSLLSSQASAADPLPTPGHCPAPSFAEARVEAGLLVLHPPEPARPAGGKRLRSHTHKSRDLGTHWAGPPVPSFVPITSRGARLDMLDRVGPFYVASYRETYDALWKRAAVTSWTNRRYDVRIFDCAGNSVAQVRPNDHFSRRDHLEVQDVRFDGKRTLYFNEACQTYSRQAGGRCSSLIAVDVVTGKLKWRSWPKRSNNVFLLHGDHIIAGYGFTGEPSALHVLRQSDGRVLTSRSLRANVFPGGNHDALALLGANQLRVGVYESNDDLLFQLAGFDGRKPSLRFVGNTPQPAWPTRRSKRKLPPHISRRMVRPRRSPLFERR